MTEEFLVLEKISKHYGSVLAVHEASMEIAAG